MAGSRKDKKPEADDSEAAAAVETGEARRDAAPETIPDAEVLDEIPPEVVLQETEAPADGGQDASEPLVLTDSIPEDMPEPKPEPEPEPEPKPRPAPPPASAGATLVPLLIGGAAAALIGFLVARYLDGQVTEEATGPTPAENAEALAGLTARIDALASDTAALAARDIGADIAAQVAPVAEGLGGATERLGAIDAALSELSERVETIAMRPVATGISPEEFDTALAEFRAQISAALSSAQGEIEAARAEAERISAEAFDAEQSALARSAWAQVSAAIDRDGVWREKWAN